MAEKKEDLSKLFEQEGQELHLPDDFNQTAHPEVEDRNQGITDMINGTMQAGAKGVLKGATWGFDDELIGGAAGLGSVIADGNPGGLLMKDPKALKSFLDSYTKLRDQARASHKQSEDEYPAASMLGEMAGAAYTPGIGALAPAKAAATASKAAKVVAPLTKGKAIGNIALDTVKGATKGALTGGVYGGVYGAGASEADVANALLNPELAQDKQVAEYKKLLKDIQDHATTGAEVGGTLHGLGSLGVSSVKNVGEFAEQRDSLPGILSDAREAFKRERNGDKVLTQKDLYNQEIKVDQAAKEVEDAIAAERARAGGMQKNALEGAEDANIKFDIKKLVQKYRTQAEKLPNLSETEKAARKQILDMLDELEKGQPVTKEVQTAPARFLPGKSIPSGEEEAVEKLRLLMAKHNVDNQLEVPLQKAETKLRQQHAMGELASETNNIAPFHEPEIRGTEAGVPGMTTTGAKDGQQLATLINEVNPKDISFHIEPKTGQKFAVLKDANGNVIKTMPVPDAVGHTQLNIVPPQTEKVTEFTGGEASSVSPTRLQEIGNSFRNLTYHGDKPIKEAKASELVTSLNKDLRGIITNEATPVQIVNGKAEPLVSGSMGEFGSKMQEANRHIHAAADAEEILFPALKGLTESERVKIKASLSDTISKLQNTNGMSARRIVREAMERIKSTRPDIAETMQNKMLDRATAYDLSRQIQQNAPSRVTGYITQAIAGGSALAGRLSAAPKTATWTKGFIRGATPEILRTMKDALMGYEDIPEDLITKLDSASKTESEKERHAMLFDIMQQPAYRQILGASYQDDGEG